MEPEEDTDPENLTRLLIDITSALEETVVERDLYKKMYNDAEAAKKAISSELREALSTIRRLNFYLENT